jgi:hypothetical protein
MNIRWDYFVNQYDTGRYVSGADGRDNRHIQFVREFASVVSVLQVRHRVYFLSKALSEYSSGQNEQRD